MSSDEESHDAWAEEEEEYSEEEEEEEEEGVEEEEEEEEEGEEEEGVGKHSRAGRVTESQAVGDDSHGDDSGGDDSHGDGDGEETGNALVEQDVSDGNSNEDDEGEGRKLKAHRQQRKRTDVPRRSNFFFHDDRSGPLPSEPRKGRGSTSASTTASVPPSSDGNTMVTKDKEAGATEDTDTSSRWKGKVYRSPDTVEKWGHDKFYGTNEDNDDFAHDWDVDGGRRRRAGGNRSGRRQQRQNYGGRTSGNAPVQQRRIRKDRGARGRKGNATNGTTKKISGSKPFQEKQKSNRQGRVKGGAADHVASLSSRSSSTSPTIQVKKQVQQRRRRKNTTAEMKREQSSRTPPPRRMGRRQRREGSDTSGTAPAAASTAATATTATSSTAALLSNSASGRKNVHQPSKQMSSNNGHNSGNTRTKGANREDARTSAKSQSQPPAQQNPPQKTFKSFKHSTPPRHNTAQPQAARHDGTPPASDPQMLLHLQQQQYMQHQYAATAPVRVTTVIDGVKQYRDVSVEEAQQMLAAQYYHQQQQQMMQHQQPAGFSPEMEEWAAAGALYAGQQNPMYAYGGAMVRAPSPGPYGTQSPQSMMQQMAYANPYSPEMQQQQQQQHLAHQQAFQHQQMLMMQQQQQQHQQMHMQQQQQQQHHAQTPTPSPHVPQHQSSPQIERSNHAEQQQSAGDQFAHRVRQLLQASSPGFSPSTRNQSPPKGTADEPGNGNESPAAQERLDELGTAADESAATESSNDKATRPTTQTHEKDISEPAQRQQPTPSSGFERKTPGQSQSSNRANWRSGNRDNNRGTKASGKNRGRGRNPRGRKHGKGNARYSSMDVAATGAQGIPAE